MMGVTGSFCFCVGVVWEYSEGTPRCASNRQTVDHLGKHRRATMLVRPHWMKPRGWHQLVNTWALPELNNLLLFVAVAAAVILFFLSK